MSFTRKENSTICSNNKLFFKSFIGILILFILINCVFIAIYVMEYSSCDMDGVGSHLKKGYVKNYSQSKLTQNDNCNKLYLKIINCDLFCANMIDTEEKNIYSIPPQNGLFYYADFYIPQTYDNIMYPGQEHRIKFIESLWDESLQGNVIPIFVHYTINIAGIFVVAIIDCTLIMAMILNIVLCLVLRIRKG